MDIKEELQMKFKRFLKSRQIVIQLTSECDNEKRFFHNQESSMEVLKEIQMEHDGSQQNEEFSSFLRQLLSLRSEHDEVGQKNELENQRRVNDKISNYESTVINMLQNPDQLTLRFLTIFDFSSEFFFSVASQCAANLSKSHFLAALGVPFKEDKIRLTQIQVKMIKSVLTGQGYKSLLEASIKNANREIFEFFRTECCLYIIHLPRDHQIEISNQLVEQDKIEMLCVLLESVDFLFPTTITDHARFQKVVEERRKFHEAIVNEKYEEINDFLKLNKKNGQLEFIYNVDNKSALFTALKAKKFKVVLHLKRKGLTAPDIDDLTENLMCGFIEDADSDPSDAIHLLATRSKIHRNEDRSEELLDMQRDKIWTWLKAISKAKYGETLLRAAAQCDKLQIVFDFARKDVAGVDLDSLDSDGIMYPQHKLVIIGAKHENEKDEQRIKGVLAHELTHYVVGMLFQNKEQPYLNKSDPKYQKFKKIVEQYSYLKQNRQDDGCHGIISSVYQKYEERDWDAELIVRIFQICVHFDDDSVKLAGILSSFKDLVEFIDSEISDAMTKLNLKAMNFVNFFNKISEFLPQNCGQKLDFHPSDYDEKLLTQKLTIVTSNVPRLFLIEIYNHLKEVHGNLVSGKNIFVTSEKLQVGTFLGAFKDVMNHNMEVNLIIDSSSGNFENLKEVGIRADRNIIIVIKDECQSNDLITMLSEIGLSPIRAEVNYNWNELAQTVKDYILEQKISFQSIQNNCLLDILGSDGDLSKIFDSEVLNKIFNGEKIEINSNIVLDENKKFKYLFQERNFIGSDKLKWEDKISQQELIDENKGKKFVIISGVAGSGKSWVMRNLALDHANSTDWVTFMDLKMFIEFFSEPSSSANIEHFIVKETLKKKPSYEQEMFNWKYQKGQVKIFFDGFDEISPKCTDFVLKLLKSFELHGSNQLFVSTRDYFRIELKEELEVKQTYKLLDFSNGEGIYLIARIWRLNDLKALASIDPKKDILESDEYGEYQKLAEKLLKSLPRFVYGIALPQMYSMIAKVTMKEKKLDKSLTLFQLYKEVWRMCFAEWSNSKGDIRAETFQESEERKLNALRLHELKAMQIFAPGRSKYCDIDPNYNNWKEDELEGCGLMSKKGDGNFHFNHRTFYEFFVAEFIMRNMRHPTSIKEAFEFMLEVTFNRTHKVIRTFLNESLKNEKKGGKEKWVKVLAKTLQEELLNAGNIWIDFTESLINFDFLGNFVVEVLKRRDSKNFTEAIFVEIIVEASENENVNEKSYKSESGDGEKLQNVSFEISSKFQKVFLKLLTSYIDDETILDLTKKITEITNPTFIKELLEFSDKDGRSIFFVLTDLKFLRTEKLERFYEYLNSYMTPSRIAAKLKEKDSKGETILHYCVNEKIYNWIKFYEYLWNLAEKVFSADREDFIKLILEVDDQGNTFIQLSFENNYDESFERFENIIKLLKRTFNKFERQTILKAKPERNESLLFLFLHRLDIEDKQDFLWDFMTDSVDSPEEFLKLISTQTDLYGNNVLLMACSFESNTLELMEKYFKDQNCEYLLEEEIRQKNHSLNKFGQNFLQYSMLIIYDINWFKNFWNSVKLSLNSAEMVSLVKNRDIFGFNYLQICSICEDGNEVEYAKLMTKSILNEIEVSGLCNEKSIEMLREAINAKLTGTSSSEQDELLSLDWINDGGPENEFQLPPCNELNELLLFDFCCVNFLHKTLDRFDTEYFESILEKAMPGMDASTLKKCLKSKNYREKNLFQVFSAKCTNKSFYLKLWEWMREKLDYETILEILDHKDDDGNNLLLIVAEHSTMEIAEIIWNQLDDFLTKEKFEKFISEMAIERNLWKENILQFAASTKNCTFLFFLEKLKTISSLPSNFVEDRIKKISIKKSIIGMRKHTILCKHTKCDTQKCHDKLWKILLNVFENDKSQFFDFVMINGSENLIFRFLKTSNNNLIGIFKNTIDKLKETFDETQFRRILMPQSKYGQYALHLVIEVAKNVEMLKIWFQHIKKISNIQALFMQVDSIKRNVLLYVARNKTIGIIKFLHEELQNLNDNEKVKALVMGQDKYRENFLMLAAEYHIEKNSFESFWNLAESFLDLNEMCQLVKQTDYGKDNVFQTAIRRNKVEVVEFIWGKIEGLMTKEQQSEYFGRKNKYGKSLMELASYNEREKKEMIEFVESIQK